MKNYRADLHIHTVLSPCGDLEMSPANIINKALEMNLDIIGISDHNSTRQCRLVREIGAGKGITVLCGAEVNTREEVHCLAFFPDEDSLGRFQSFLDLNLPDIRNVPSKFGYQVVVDEKEDIIYEEKRLLIAALNASIGETEAEVHRLGGIFIPAHIDRPRFSVLGQLGFLPPDLKADALEVSPATDREKFERNHPELSAYTFVSFSDAHYLPQIGKKLTIFEMDSPGFDEIRKALQKTDGRKTQIIN